MISLSFDELRLIAQIRNISDYENKYKEHLIKTLSEAKPETPKPEKKIKTRNTKNQKNAKTNKTRTRTRTKNKSKN